MNAYCDSSGINRCAPTACTRYSDCEAHYVCDTSAGTCKGQCETAADCQDGYLCEAFTCVAAP